jgi:hypothetical protein
VVARTRRNNSQIPFGVRTMSDRSARRSNTNEPPPPRPVALIAAVVFAAAVSTWHWYRPLPKKAAVIAGGPFATESEPQPQKQQSRIKSRWQDSGLVFPSENPGELSFSSEKNGTEVPGDRTDDTPSSSRLTGNRDLALLPFREINQPLNQSIAQIPLSAVPPPSDKPLTLPPPAESRLWSPTPQKTDVQGGLGDRTASVPPPQSGSNADPASPFRVPPQKPGNPVLSMKTDVWPDQGFAPGSTRAVVPTLAPAKSDESPGLLTLSSNRIRTLDQEPAVRFSVRPDPQSVEEKKRNAARDPRHHDSKNVIRQPAPMDSVTK